MPGARRDQRRRRLWRQFLRHRRAAGELPRHGRPFRRRPDRLEPGGAAAAQREIHASCIPKIPASTGCRTCCGPARRRIRRRMRATPSSTATRRSTARPCGTGTSARMAQLHAKGRLKAGDAFVHESIIGSLFNGRVERETTVADKPAIVPSIGGWARHDRAATRSSSTTATRSRTASSSAERCVWVTSACVAKARLRARFLSKMGWIGARFFDFEPARICRFVKDIALCQ